MNTTIKQTRGDLKQERQIAYAAALKAVDYEKQYQQALRDIAEAMFDMDFDENNCQTSNTNVQ